MSQEPTQRELELARRLEALEAQSARPVISGGGIIVNTLNAVMQKVPPSIITWGVVAFLAFHGWQKTNETIQLYYGTEKAKGERDKAAADLAAIQQDGGHGDSLALEKLQADIKNAEAARDDAQADAKAWGKEIDGVTQKQRELEAEVRKAHAAADKAAALADSLTQDAGGNEPMAVAQKRQEVEELEGKAALAVESARGQLPFYAGVSQIEKKMQNGGDMFAPFYRNR